jgi:toxin ParE1/3/4
MAKIVLRQKAIDDLNSIWEYTFAEWSETQADKYYDMLRFSCLEIGKNPEIGKSYNSINKNLQGLHSGRHIIFYEVINENEIEIIRILHERMDLKQRLQE